MGYLGNVWFIRERVVLVFERCSMLNKHRCRRRHRGMKKPTNIGHASSHTTASENEGESSPTSTAAKLERGNISNKAKAS
jgi:hypothetical protein